MTTITEIDPKTSYVVIDSRNGQVVYRTTYANRTRARRWADRKDLEYGAVRYVAGVERSKPGKAEQVSANSSAAAALYERASLDFPAPDVIATA